MGHEVVGEHRQPFEVGELGDPGTVQVGGGDLRALEEWDLELAVAGDVGEALPVAERRSTSATARAAGSARPSASNDPPYVGARYARRGRAATRRTAPISSCSRSWPSTPASSAGLDRRPARSPSTARGLEPLADPGRDREVAGRPGALSQRREPARAEVDRIERQPERGPRRGSDRLAVRSPARRRRCRRTPPAAPPRSSRSRPRRCVRAWRGGDPGAPARISDVGPMTTVLATVDTRWRRPRMPT